jgi:hypothetical protein
LALILWVKQNWAKIVAAAKGEAGERERVLSYRAQQRRPIDIPYVAQRMLPNAEYVREPQLSHAPASMLLRPRPAGRQMAFEL